MGEPGEPGQLLAIAEELYALSLPDFTGARDSRAKELKAADAGLATRVKGLRKPSAAAWVVNLLARHENDQLDQVLAVGDALREAQASLSADDLRSLTRQRRQLTAAVTTRARAVAAEHGHRVSEAVSDQVEATLTAAILDAGCAAAVRSGLLVAALSTTGVDPVPRADLVAAVAVPEAVGHRAAAAPDEPAAARPELHVVPDPDAAAKARDAARERLREAEVQVGAAREAAEAAAADVARLEARSLQVQSEIEELRGRLADLEATAEEVDDELADAEDVRDEATACLGEVTGVRDDAAAALADLED